MTQGKSKGLCQGKRSKSCERYRERKRPWPYGRNEADMSQKFIQEHGTRWVNKWQESKR